MADRAESENLQGLADNPNATAEPARVFISYASNDVAVAHTVCAALETAGFRCWIAPRDVVPGTLYADGIVRAINDSTILVVILSKDSVASAHVGKELERASSKRHPIIAVRTDTTPLTPAFEYFLSESQWIAVETGGTDAAIAKLIDAVQLHLIPGSPAVHRVLAAAPGVERKAAAPRRSWVIAAAVVAVVVAALLAGKILLGKRIPTEQPKIAATNVVNDKSIAVLPFTDMSEKHDQEYFGDGMAEEILDLLAKIPGLSVIGRTSSFQFKGKNEDLRTIGSKLNAAYILEGSVRNSGDQVRITAQLINTKTGAHEWSETYDRQKGDVLKLQDAIAVAVAREMQLTVAPGYLNLRPSVNNTEAYDLMLRGRHAADRWDEEGLDGAVTLLKQAIDRDGASADAAAELAFAYYKQGADGFVIPASAFESARRAAATALRLDPKSARAHYVLGKIHIVYDWDWAAAEREFKEAATLAPGSVDPLSGEVFLSMALGHWEDGLRQSKAALALDPLDANSFEALGNIQWGRGHLPESEAALRRTLDIRPTYTWGHYYVGRLLLASGYPSAAVLEMQRETTDEGRQAGLAMAYHALGRKADSDAALGRMVEQHPNEYAFYIADVYAFRGQVDEALHWLERTYAQKDPYLVYLKLELLDKSLTSDPRYKAFLRKMNLPESR